MCGSALRTDPAAATRGAHGPNPVPFSAPSPATCTDSCSAQRAVASCHSSAPFQHPCPFPDLLLRASTAPGSPRTTPAPRILLLVSSLSPLHPTPHSSSFLLLSPGHEARWGCQVLLVTPSSETDAKSSFRAQGKERAPEEQRWSLQHEVKAPPVVGWLSSRRRSLAADFWDANTSAWRDGGCCAPPGLPQQGEGWLCQDHCCKCPPVWLSRPAWHPDHH